MRSIEEADADAAIPGRLLWCLGMIAALMYSPSLYMDAAIVFANLLFDLEDP